MFSSGGLQPTPASLLSQHGRVPHLLLGGQPGFLPQRSGGVGARAEGMHASRALHTHWDPGVYRQLFNSFYGSEQLVCCVGEVANASDGSSGCLVYLLPLLNIKG